MPHFISIQQTSVLNILNMLYNLHFFSSKCRLFHNATLFGFCITHILNTVCAKIKKKIRRQKVKDRMSSDLSVTTLPDHPTLIIFQKLHASDNIVWHKTNLHLQYLAL